VDNMAYSVETWAKAKADYETGNYSVQALSIKYKISAPAIVKRSMNEKWVKGALKPIIEKTIQEKYIAAFAKAGIDETRIAES
jgi:hypothetical protein